MDFIHAYNEPRSYIPTRSCELFIAATAELRRKRGGVKDVQERVLSSIKEPRSGPRSSCVVNGNKENRPMCWLTPVVPALRRMKQETHHVFKASLYYTVTLTARPQMRPCPKTSGKKESKQNLRLFQFMMSVTLR